MNGTYHLDLDKLNKSVETISGIEDCISSRDLSEGFSNLENYFRDVNFEHGNCLKYKEDLELIFSNIDEIKRKVSNLTDALITTTENYGEIEALDSKDIKELTSIYSDTPSSENLGNLAVEANQFRKDLATDLTPPGSTSNQTTTGQTTTQYPNTSTNNDYNNQSNNVTTVPQVEEPIDDYQTKTINTVPIGIAIGASGIAGSIGAVIVNEKYGKKTKNKQLEDYDDADDEYGDDDDNYYPKKEENIEYSASPYMASRQEREADKYYGNEIILEDEDDSDSDNGKYYE